MRIARTILRAEPTDARQIGSVSHGQSQGTAPPTELDPVRRNWLRFAKRHKQSQRSSRPPTSLCKDEPNQVRRLVLFRKTTRTKPTGFEIRRRAFANRNQPGSSIG